MAHTDDQWFEQLTTQADDLGESVPSATRGIQAQLEMAEKQPEKHAIAGNRYDEHLYSEARDSVEPLATVLRKSWHTYRQSEELASDILRSLYQIEPREQSVEATYERNAQAIHDMLSTADYKRLHGLTQLDSFNAALATANLTEALIKVLAKQEEEDRQRKLQRGQPNPKGDSKQPGQSGPAGPGGSASGSSEAGQKSQQGSGEPDQTGKQGGQAGQGGQGKRQPKAPTQKQPGDGADQGKKSGQTQPSQEDLRGMQRRVAARAAAKQAEQDINEAHDALEAFGGMPDEIGSGWGSQAGQAQLSGDIKERARLALTILHNEMLRRIAQLCGRMKKIAAQVERQKLQLGNAELCGVTTGNDILNALPAELALLGHEHLKPLFYLKLAERSLNIYERYTPEPVGRGPIIVAVDESGSMRGQKNEWAKAIVLALLSLAAKQERDLRVIHFASGYNILVTDYPKGKGTPDQVKNTALHFWSGGTDYEPWMKQALVAIQESTFEKADVIVLTDGECAVSDTLLHEWQTTKAARGFRAIGILTGTPTGGAVLRQFCDTVAHFQGVQQDEALLTEIFRSAV